MGKSTPTQVHTGTMLRFTLHPVVLEAAVGAGMEFLMADLEHGAFTIDQVESFAAIARNTRLRFYIRAPQLSREWVSRPLDSGVHGVMIPMLETEEQARQLVGWAKYPPLGRRGVSSIGCHTRFNKINDLVELMARFNNETYAIAQIETQKGVDACEAIAAVEGIDALVIGPNDLSVSLGCPGEQTTPHMEHAITRVAQAARKNGKLFGMHAGLSCLKHYAHLKMSFLMCSNDMTVVHNGVTDIAENLTQLRNKGER